MDDLLAIESCVEDEQNLFVEAGGKTDATLKGSANRNKGITGAVGVQLLEMLDLITEIDCEGHGWMDGTLRTQRLEPKARFAECGADTEQSLEPEIGLLEFDAEDKLLE